MLEALLIFDAAVSLQLQNLAAGMGHMLWFAITMLGHPLPWLVLAAWWYWSGKENESFFLVTVTVFSLAVTGMLKGLVARPRPTPLDFNVRQEPSWLAALSENVLNRFSFPSGHAMLVSSHAVFSRKHIQTIGKKILVVALVMLVGLSRIILGQHFVSDVLAGLAIGGLLGMFCEWLLQELRDHHFKLSKAEEMIGFLVALALAVIALAWTEVPAVVLAMLGYFAGFFLVKEIDFAQSKVSGAQKAAKMAIGFGALALGLGIALAYLTDTTQLAFFFLAGFWISAIWPWTFEVLSKPHSKATKTA